MAAKASAGEPKLARCPWTGEERKVHAGSERKELVAAAKDTAAFKGYENYGQLKWLDRGIVCMDFDVAAKRAVLEAEAAERAAGKGNAGHDASPGKRRPGRAMRR